MKKTLKASLWLTLAVILSTAGTFQDHGYSVTKLNQNLVHATGINNLGQISGFFQDGGWHGIIITGNNFTIFDLPGHSGRTWVYGINALGQLVGNTDGSSFINTGVDVIPLNVPSDWNGRDTAARGLSNSGQVV